MKGIKMSEDLKKTLKDTPKEEKQEEAQGTVDVNEAETPQDVSETKPAIDVEKYEKDLQKKEMRINQLENKLEEIISQPKDDSSEVVARLQEELNALREERQKDAEAEAEAAREKEMTEKAKSVFDKIVSSYPEKVQKVLKATYGDNPWGAFGEVESWFDAEENLRTKANSIEDTLSANETKVDSNNPIEPKEKPKVFEFNGDGSLPDSVLEELSKRNAKDFESHGYQYPFRQE